MIVDFDEYKRKKEYKQFLENLRLDIISFELGEKGKSYITSSEDLFALIKDLKITMEQIEKLPAYTMASDDTKKRFKEEIIKGLDEEKKGGKGEAKQLTKGALPGVAAFINKEEQPQTIPKDPAA